MSKKPRGFAALPKEQLAEISRKGGIAAYRLGVGHRWTSEEAQHAGRKGGTISRRRSKSEHNTQEQE